MKKQLIAFVLSVVLICIVFSACGNTNTVSSGPESQEEKSQISSTVAEDPIREVVVTRWYNKPASQQEIDRVDAAINEILNEEYGLNISQVWLDDYRSTAKLKLSANDKMDVMWDSSFTHYIKENMAYNIKDIIQQYEDLYNLIPEKYWNSLTYYDGGLYYIPCYKEAATGNDLAIPTDIYEATGLDLSGYTIDHPLKLADLDKVFRAIQETGMAQYAFQRQNHMVYLLDGDIFRMSTFAYIHHDNPTEVVGIFDDDKQTYQEFWNYAKGWMQDGLLDENMISGDTSTQADDIKSGYVGSVNWIRTPDNQANCELRYGRSMTLIPISNNYVTSTSATGSGYFIPSYTEDVDAALSFVQALYTDLEIGNLFTFGMEGTDYKLVDGRIEKIADSGFGSSPWCSTTVFNVSLQVGESENKYQQYRDFNEAGIETEFCGFWFDNTNVSAEIAAISNVVNTYHSLLSMGAQNSDVTPENYEKAMKDAGYDKVLAEYQKQYREFLENKK